MTKERLLRRLRINGKPVKMLGNQLVFDTIVEEHQRNQQEVNDDKQHSEKENGPTSTR